MITIGRSHPGVAMERYAYKLILSVVGYRLVGSVLKLLLIAALSPLVLQSGAFRELAFKPFKPV